jgi:hypothetical protein
MHSIRHAVAVVVLGLGLILAAGVSVQRAQAKEDAPAMVLRHTVLFKFKEAATATEIRAVEAAFAALPSKVDGIIGFEWGTDVGVENLSDGFTHCFQVTFRTEADRARYLPHPDHEAFTKIAGPVIEKVIVIDYWTKP